MTPESLDPSLNAGIYGEVGAKEICAALISLAGGIGGPP